MHASTRECASQCSAITAVVAFATENQCFLADEIVLETRANRVHAGATRGFHQEQGRSVVVLNCETVDFANLFGGEYRLHVGMIGRPGKNGQSRPRITRILGSGLARIRMAEMGKLNKN